MEGGMETAMSPNYAKIGTLHGDFGPVPAMVRADVQLARSGHLEQYLEARDPGHTLHLVTIWIYDHPKMLNDAVANGLTDDQWGMVKERDYNVGPWYLIIPAIIHVERPGGVTGTGFVLAASVQPIAHTYSDSRKAYIRVEIRLRPGSDPHRVLEQLARMDGLAVDFAAQFPAPLADLLRSWTDDHRHEDITTSLDQLEAAIRADQLDQRDYWI
jgi:hypothetical protein